MPMGPGARERTFEVELNLSDLSCQRNRSTQHFLEVYSQEFEILVFFSDAS